ncbi:MAG TPA: endolytic transglycosylase MltG [Ktedonobacteraceae bacterium]|nr:endolytic transglycosylase MltG [Ktedonobacteraceae bacterium]
MRGRSARGAIIAVFLLGILIFGGVFYAWKTATDIFQPVTSGGAGRNIPIQIMKGETAAQIADDLQNKGLIRNALAFRIWARIKGLDAQLQAGGYDHLNTNMTISDIIDQLLNASPDVIYVSIPEGYRIEQIAQAFAGVGLVKFNAQDFLKYTLHPDQFPDAAKYPVLKLIPAHQSMEGLLFPATYDVPIDGDARYVVNRMLTVFDDYVQKYDLAAKAKAHNLNEYQMVILASLVQREIANVNDAPGVAGVYWNRAFSTVPNDTAGFLGSDPSVEYARDTQNPPKQYWLPLADAGKNIATNSPWNTYINKGLTPTPICSPGLATLEAAASPKQSGYFYFFSTKSGSIVYATTYPEFLQKYNSSSH